MSRLAHQLAAEGYGVEDLIVRCGISERQAREVVWDAEKRRLMILAAEDAARNKAALQLQEALAKEEELKLRIRNVFEKVS